MCCLSCCLFAGVCTTWVHWYDCLLFSYCKTTAHSSMILATGSWLCGACVSVSTSCASSHSALRSTRNIATFQFWSLNRYSQHVSHVSSQHWCFDFVLLYSFLYYTIQCFDTEVLGDSMVSQLVKSLLWQFTNSFHCPDMEQLWENWPAVIRTVIGSIGKGIWPMLLMCCRKICGPVWALKQWNA